MLSSDVVPVVPIGERTRAVSKEMEHVFRSTRVAGLIDVPVRIRSKSFTGDPSPSTSRLRIVGSVSVLKTTKPWADVRAELVRIVIGRAEQAEGEGVFRSRRDGRQKPACAVRGSQCRCVHSSEIPRNTGASIDKGVPVPVARPLVPSLCSGNSAENCSARNDRCFKDHTFQLHIFPPGVETQWHVKIGNVTQPLPKKRLPPKISKSSTNTDPLIRLLLGWNLCAICDGQDMGKAPNATVAALAVLLQRSSGNEVPRAAIARRLFPESSRSTALAALRQALNRLRLWLGPSSIEGSYSGVRACGAWTLEFVEGAQVGAASHPELEAIFTEAKGDAFEHAADRNALSIFAESVRSMAEVDIDAARGMVAGAPGALQDLPLAEGFHLLELTKSRRRTDPYSFEHQELLGTMLYESGAMDRCQEAFLRALRIATHAGRSGQTRRAQSLLLFCMLEAGDIPGAEEMLQRLTQGRQRFGLLEKNAKAAFQWNIGDWAGAAEMMKSCEGEVLGASRADSLHFWVNACVLGAETNDAPLFHVSDAFVRELLIPGRNRKARWLHELALQIKRSWTDPVGAASAFDKLIPSLKEAGYNTLVLYATEARCVALARAGELFQSESGWTAVSTMRRSMGLRPTPRVRAMRRGSLG
jgi:hypothetical protein